MKPRTYRCQFMYCGQTYSVFSAFGVQEFAQGFWIDTDMSLVNVVDHPSEKFWIPPGKIEYIEKVQEE